MRSTVIKKSVTATVMLSLGVLLASCGESGAPGCSSQDSISLLKKTLSDHANWVQFVYGFNPNDGYKIKATFVAKKPNKTLHKSFCKAVIKPKSNNGETSYIDVYYNLQYSTNGNYIHIDVLNPYNR